MPADRMQVCSFAAVGSVTFYADKPDILNTGASVFAKGTGNWSAKILANNFPDAQNTGSGAFGDVTSMFVGAAQMTQATNPVARVAGFQPYGLRISVDSVQAANNVNFAINF